MFLGSSSDVCTKKGLFEGHHEIIIRQNQLESNIPQTPRIFWAAVVQAVWNFVRANIVRIIKKIFDIIDAVLSGGSKLITEYINFGRVKIF